MTTSFSLSTSVQRPINKLRKYGIKATDEKILEYVTGLEFGKLQKLNLK